MDLKHSLEVEHSKKITMQIIKYVGYDKVRFDDLIRIFFGKDKKLQQRAAWPLSYLAEGNPRLIEPYLKKLVALLEQPGLHAAVARNILRIFQQYDLPENYHGELIDICFRFILKPSTPIAIKAFAISTATNIAKPYPELKRELLIVLNELQEQSLTPGLKVRLKNAYRILNS